MKNLLARFMREDDGEDLIEYGLLAAFVAAVATAVIVADPLGIKGSLKNAYNRAKTALDNS
jgi:Flp pilus assembly pilin Flp